MGSGLHMTNKLICYCFGISQVIEIVFNAKCAENSCIVPDYQLRPT